jgi:CheY-like chemotaxis protein
METDRLIWIVEDGADYRCLLRDIFTRYLPAYTLRLFVSGQELLDALAYPIPLAKLILVDLPMPGLDGLQTICSLRQQLRSPTIPVVIMSGTQASTTEIERCYEAGANSFLLKQTSFGLLRQSLLLICQYWLDLNQEPLQAAQELMPTNRHR